MKAIVSAVFMSTMLLASAGSASATSYLQASSTEEQLASDTKPKVVISRWPDPIHRGVDLGFPQTH